MWEQRLKAKIDRVSLWWISFNERNQKIRWLPFLLIFIFTVMACLSFFGPAVKHLELWVLFALIASTCGMFYATKKYYEPLSGYVFIASFILFTLFIYIFWLILIVVAIYSLYWILEERRRKKIERIAHASPSKLSGVTYNEPQVEIVIKGDRM